MSLHRLLATASLVLVAFAFLAPAADATLVSRTIFAEEFGFST